MSSKILFILFDAINQADIDFIINNDNSLKVCNLNRSTKGNYFQTPEFDINKIEGIQDILKDARENFLHFIRETSIVKLNGDKDIRSFKIFDLPLYWLTDYSVKHPYNHSLYNIFVLREFISRRVFRSIDVIVYCPLKYTYLTALINSLLPKVSLKVFGKPRSKWVNNIKFLVNHLKLILKLVLLPKGSSSDGISSSFLFFTKNNENSYLKKITRELKESNVFQISEVGDVNYFNWIFGAEINHKLLRCKPNVFELFVCLINATRLKLIMRNQNIELLGFSLESNFIFKEIDNVLNSKAHLLYTYLWLNKFFKSQKSRLNVLYEDEFYDTGRMISAANIFSYNSNVKCFGVQHGMFSEFHTVYNVSDIEIKSTSKELFNGLPIPNYFITWGQYFSKWFLKNNTLAESFILELGNPLFINAAYKYHPKLGKVKESDYNILYCVTSYELFVKELPIVNEILKKMKNVFLTLRMHPNFDFEIVPDNFSNVESFSFSKYESIHTAISKSDLVLTSAHSTIFLDSIAMKVPVIRLQTVIFDSTMELNINGCITIGEFDFNEEKLKLFLLKKYREDIAKNFIFLKPERWIKFLRESNA